MPAYTLVTTDAIQWSHNHKITELEYQLKKDLFIGLKAYNLTLESFHIDLEGLVLEIRGSFEAINELASFLFTRLAEKTQQVIYRSYYLLNSESL